MFAPDGLHVAVEQEGYNLGFEMIQLSLLLIPKLTDLHILSIQDARDNFSILLVNTRTKVSCMKKII